MSDFNAKTLAILGRQPELGLAELECLYGAPHIRPLNDAALLDMDTEHIEFKRLGGTVKLARVLSVLATTSWPELVAYLNQTVPRHLSDLAPGGFTLGLSVYGLPVSANKINQDMLALKKIIRNGGRRVRIVPNKATSLNSAQVLHNKLTTKGAWELLFVRDGQQTILAQSIFVQDIEAYAARDQARPKRDARVGMLPPKLAQIMINLANPRSGATILDPFCGSGVVLQEALLMGFSVMGSDVEPRMVDYSKVNLEWLADKRPIPKDKARLLVADATKAEWPTQIDSVVSEIYLGKPLTVLPSEPQLDGIVNEVNELLKNFLLNLSQQLRPGVKICLAVPSWRKKNGEFINLDCLAKITDMGYTYLDLKHVRREELVYYRKDQIVARRLVLIKKV